MTKKDYELLAKAIGWTKAHYDSKGVENIKARLETLDGFTDVIIEMLEKENPKFEARKFLDAVQFHTN